MQPKPHPSRLDYVINLLLSKAEALRTADEATRQAVRVKAEEQLAYENRMRRRTNAPAA